MVVIWLEQINWLRERDETGIKTYTQVFWLTDGVQKLASKVAVTVEVKPRAIMAERRITLNCILEIGGSKSESCREVCAIHCVGEIEAVMWSGDVGLVLSCTWLEVAMMLLLASAAQAAIHFFSRIRESEWHLAATPPHLSYLQFPGGWIKWLIVFKFGSFWQHS